MNRYLVILKLAIVLGMGAAICKYQSIVDRVAGMPGPDDKLLVAIVCRDQPAVEAALADGVSPNTRTCDGATPLHYAAGCGNPDAVRSLLAAGADVNAQDSYGRTALMCAAQSDHVDVAQLLLSCGADQSILDRRSRSARDYATCDGARIANARLLALLGGRTDRPDCGRRRTGDRLALYR